jgi:hypothetical protein
MRESLPPSSRRTFAPLPYRASFSSREFDIIRRGLSPQQMEDKWRIHMEGDWLHFDRSWTSITIYRIRFARPGDRHDVVEARINANREEFRRNTDEYEAALLDFLIRRLLLHQDVPFPLPADLDAHEGIFQHSVAGSAYPTRRLGATWWSHSKDALHRLLGSNVTELLHPRRVPLSDPAPGAPVAKTTQLPGDDFGLVLESHVERGSVADTCFVCGKPRSRPAGTPRLACGPCHARARLPDTGALIDDLIQPLKPGDFPLEGSTLSLLFSPVMIDDRRGAIESVAGGWGVHEELHVCDNLFDYRLRHYEPYTSRLGQIRAGELREKFEELGPRRFVMTVYARLPVRARATFDSLSAWYTLATLAKRVRDRHPLRTNQDVVDAARAMHDLHAEADDLTGPTDMLRRIESLQAASV